MTDTQRQLPIMDNLSSEWFKAAEVGRLLIQRCRKSGKYQFYPRLHSLETLKPDVEWVEASGRGKLHTFSIVHRTPNSEFAADCPYVLAIIELDEGPRITSRVVDVPHEDLHCDMAVRVVFTKVTDEVTLPYFTAAGK